MELGTTVLRTSDVARLPKACERPAWCDAKTVHVAGRNARRTRQPDEERVQIRALPTEVAGFEHRPDVPESASSHRRIAHGVLDDPFVDRTRLRNVVWLAPGDASRGIADDAVERDQASRTQIGS